MLAYRGKVDEWRFLRNGFNLIHCSLVKERADIMEVLPLPFDGEIKTSEQVNVNDMIEQYYLLQKSGALN